MSVFMTHAYLGYRSKTGTTEFTKLVTAWRNLQRQQS